MSAIEKYILAVITTDPARTIGGTAVFICKTEEEMHFYAKNLEAILDGIAHGIGDDLYIVVKH
ncbi:capping complex subunit for YIEGIA [Metabacillus fastidiosus]|uniref:capping complex subunit for YIEGIA n=1 Tax=Metabacillus fastidiosus TaxID=1458 RepID=UPI003D27EF05